LGWEDSLEGVLYNLRVFGAETKEDERYEILIAETVQRLPKDVARAHPKMVLIKPNHKAENVKINRQKIASKMLSQILPLLHMFEPGLES
jgi:hypothetical protein